LLEHVDHLSVITSGVEVEQLLCVSKLTAGTGEAQASTVIQWLKETEWGIEDQVAALCFKIQLHQIPVTTLVLVQCSLTENKLNKDLYLACHNVMELAVRAAFEKTPTGTSIRSEILF